VRFHILPDPDPGVVQNTGETICSGGDPVSFGFSTLPDENYGSFKNIKESLEYLCSSIMMFMSLI
jgi:hypothetical protein